MPDLRLVDTPNGEAIAAKVQRLQAEARALARDHVKALGAAMASTEALAQEIADGGDAYPPGIRDVARRLAEDLDSRLQTLESIIGKTGA